MEKKESSGARRILDEAKVIKNPKTGRDCLQVTIPMPASAIEKLKNMPHEDVKNIVREMLIACFQGMQKNGSNR